MFSNKKKVRKHLILERNSCKKAHNRRQYRLWTVVGCDNVAVEVNMIGEMMKMV